MNHLAQLLHRFMMMPQTRITRITARQVQRDRFYRVLREV